MSVKGTCTHKGGIFKHIRNGARRWTLILKGRQLFLSSSNSNFFLKIISGQFSKLSPKYHYFQVAREVKY